MMTQNLRGLFWTPAFLGHALATSASVHAAACLFSSILFNSFHPVDQPRKRSIMYKLLTEVPMDWLFSMSEWALPLRKLFWRTWIAHVHDLMDHIPLTLTATDPHRFTTPRVFTVIKTAFHSLEVDHGCFQTPWALESWVIEMAAAMPIAQHEADSRKWVEP